MQQPVDYTKLSTGERRRVREQYVTDQNGLCMYCKSPLDSSPSPEIAQKEIDLRLFPPHFLKYPVHLQHCHNTGMTEGAVHAHCNAVLWQYLGR